MAIEGALLERPASASRSRARETWANADGLTARAISLTDTVRDRSTTRQSREHCGAWPLSFRPGRVGESEGDPECGELRGEGQGRTTAGRLHGSELRSVSGFPVVTQSGTAESGTWSTAETGYSDVGEFERQYRLIGLWRGPYASRDGRQSLLGFWREQGPLGLHWLVSRLKTETSLEVAIGVAELLCQTGAPVVRPIFRALEREPSVLQAYALFLTLSWLKGAELAGLEYALHGLIRRYLQHANSDVREAAGSATALLPITMALPLLRKRVRLESDAAVRQAMQDEIHERIAD